MRQEKFNKLSSTYFIKYGELRIRNKLALSVLKNKTCPANWLQSHVTDRKCWTTTTKTTTLSLPLQISGWCCCPTCQWVQWAVSEWVYYNLAKYLHSLSDTVFCGLTLNQSQVLLSVHTRIQIRDKLYFPYHCYFLSTECLVVCWQYVRWQIQVTKPILKQTFHQ